MAEAAGAPLRVLYSFSDPRTDRKRNPYLFLLVSAMPAGAQLGFFSWARALRGDFDVFHMQWPEHAVLSRQPARTLLKCWLFTLAVALMRVRRVAVVQTVHNLKPHEQQPGPIGAFLRRMERWTDCFVLLNDTRRPATGADVCVIPHGHYRESYDLPMTLGEVGDGLSFVTFGLLRPYKNIESVIDAFRQVPDAGARLTVRGSAESPEYFATLAARAHDERIALVDEFVPDDQLGALLEEHALVVLPYKHLYNSGAVFLALSAARPVVLPDGPAARELEAEFGADWVHLYAGDLSGDALVAAAERTRKLAPDSAPDLSARDWPTVAAAHLDCYRRTVARVRGGAA